MFIKNKIANSSLICYFLIVVVFALVRMLSAFGIFNALGPSADYIFNVIIQIIILFAMSILLFSAFQKNNIRDTFKFYGYKKISFKAVLISIAIGIIVYFLNIFVATFFNALLSLFGYSSSSTTIYLSSYPFWLFLVNLVVSAVLPGICEETVHRGMLLKGLSGIGQTRALVISSLLFGLMHMNIEQFFYATLIGFLVGYLALVCDSIYPAMIIHFMNNAISVFATYSSFNHLGFEKIVQAFNVALQINFFLGFLLIIIFVVGLAFLLKYLIKLLFKETTLKNMRAVQQQIMNQLQKQAYINELENIKNDQPSGKEITISFDEFDKLYKENNQKLGLMSKLDKDLLSSGKTKLSLTNKILLTGIYIITIGVTIFTFIWGVL